MIPRLASPCATRWRRTILTMKEIGSERCIGTFSLDGVSDDLLRHSSAASIPTVQNSWRGSNRGGWNNAEFNATWEVYNRTLEEKAPIRQNVELERIIYTDVGAIPLYFQLVVTAHTGNLKGMVTRTTPDAPNAIHNSWLWE